MLFHLSKNVNSRFSYKLLAAAVWLLSVACGDNNSAATAAEIVPPPPGARQYDPVQLARGEELYRQYCAVCHLERGSGTVNWRQPGADGKFPPPPLNGTAHTWHHPWVQLHSVIKQGGPPGQSNMPAWQDRLNDQQIDDIIAWLTSLWSDEVYAMWYERDRKAREYLKNR